MRKTPAELRRSGKTVKDIALALGLSVAEVRELIDEEKAETRKELAQTPRNERARGLLDPCICGHVHKSHTGEGHNGSCEECDKDMNFLGTCEEYEAKSSRKRRTPDLNHLPLGKYWVCDWGNGDVTFYRSWGSNTPIIQSPSVATHRRRLRRHKNK